jgi:hypothetical protein
MSMTAFSLILAQASTSGPSLSLQWAIVGFALILGLIVTVSPARRTYEIKRPKDE